MFSCGLLHTKTPVFDDQQKNLHHCADTRWCVEDVSRIMVNKDGWWERDRVKKICVISITWQWWWQNNQPKSNERICHLMNNWPVFYEISLLQYVTAGWLPFYGISTLMGYLMPNSVFIIYKGSKVGDHSRGWPEGSLFDSYYTKV